MRLFHGLAMIFLSLLASIATGAEPAIPTPLQPWVDWAMHGAEQTRCPVLYNQVNHYRCAWPSYLRLDIDPQGGHFVQRWTVNAESWLGLPGDHRHWPQNVQMDGFPALVIERDGRPILKAEPGEHTLSGRFNWQSIPEALRVPDDTALLSLTVEGTPVAVPHIEDDSRVWLRKRQDLADKKPQDYLEFQVFRKIIDDIPLRLTTRLELKVSGQAREVLVGPILLENFIPLSLQNPLPARLEPDGRLRVQVKPGSWALTLVARHLGPIDALTLPKADGPWADEEIWSFQAMNDLRIVKVEGATSLDPAQTNLPDPWRNLPAYLLQPGQPLSLIARQRGDADPAPDRLSLNKTLWLDFEGNGYTVQDRLEGTISQSTRLQADPGVQLGRVTINDQDQFITRLPDSSAAGVEVRQGRIQLTADSRLETSDIGNLPAVGWQVSPVQIQTHLNLPPGWRLMAVSGADSASNAWLYRWTLLDLFVVLIIAFSFARLWSWPYGVLALLGLILTYHEPTAPRLIWLNLLAAIALLRVLPLGRFKTVTDWYRKASLLALLVISLIFAVQQVRSGLYPQLTLSAVAPVFTDSLSEAPMLERFDAEEPQAVSKPATKRSDSPGYRYYQKRYSPDIQVQTGPGLPTWRWRQARLRWSGPVAEDQRLGLYLLPPWATRVLLFIGVGLLLAMLVRVLEVGRLNLPARRLPIAALCLLPTLVAAPPDARADFPSLDLLKQLRARLTQAPDCQPICAALESLHIRATADELQLRLSLHSQVDTAIPLPLPGNVLAPSRVAMDSNATMPLYRAADDLLWGRLPAGRHDLELHAPLPTTLTRLQIPLPMTPGHVELDIEGWRVEGVYEGVASGNQIQLNRQRQSADALLQPGVMPAFVRVERELLLGIDWEVHTRVQRSSQADSAAVLEIPLLAGERVTTPGIRVRNGRVLLNLPAKQPTLEWSSALDRSERIDLRAGETTHFIETWRLRAAPIWHVETTGIPVIHRHDDSGEWTPEWRPWPGETLSLTISRPEGVAGKTVTIDDVRLQVNPGKRATEATLALNIRSSRGTEHTLTLPEQAELGTVTINGKSQPIKQTEQAVVLPLVPGTQQVNLTWRRKQEITTRYVTPAVDLGTDSVNTRITLRPPYDRWTLLTGGPALGPAVLFWAVLIVIALGAVALSRFAETPLKALQWFLLGLGLSQAGLLAILPVAGWLLLLGQRKTVGDTLGKASFNLFQVLLGLLTLVALGAMLLAIQQGLLGSPSMQITGNGSTAYQLQWYQDRSPTLLPQAWVVSIPLWIYRGLMLAWALWLAFALLKWLGWAWSCFSSGGIWRRLELSKAKTADRNTT